MKPEEQRIAIAEVCGYVWNIGLPTKSGWWTDPHGFQVSWGNNKSDALNQIEGTNYLNDLNACHEMEKTLTHDRIDGAEFGRYLDNLVEIAYRKPAHPSGYSTAVNATATQRCESFLKTLNLWIE